MEGTMETVHTLQDVIDQVGGNSEMLGIANLDPKCLTQPVTLIAQRGGYDIYELGCGDAWVLAHTDGSTHLVTLADIDDQDTEQSRVVGAVLLTADDLDVIFDNGGGITVQTRGFVHAYSDPAQAANDVKSILATDYDPTRWDGDEPQCWQGNYPDPEIERSGGYKWIRRDDVLSEMASTDPINVSGYAEREFWAALTGRTVAEE
jgi:hypothetical protein